MSGTASPVHAPGWLANLSQRVDTVPPEWFSRFTPPRGGGRRRSAVLILIGPVRQDAEAAQADGQVGETVILTRRASTLRSHPGQVSFPGGAWEAGDDDDAATALREAREEIGLDPQGVSVLSHLPTLHIPVSGYDVTPVLGWWQQPAPIYPRQPAEVEAVLEVSVAQLVDPQSRCRVRHPSGYIGPAFVVGGSTIWGFTAGVLDRLLELGGLAQEWDPRRIVDIG